LGHVQVGRGGISGFCGFTHMILLIPALMIEKIAEGGELAMRG
jgi:hypothetical protein